ncbi:receptor-type tyrosine-protein phosphatase H [Mixophyes fleayi]|uniref:receptor-type tyrosine-protein phosphatase H n=1 Tax=Mixophyes fleayi TaxID=3061075 RepID=UPI003F4D73E8
MACHYITPGRCKPVVLLQTFLICLSGWSLTLAAPAEVSGVGTLNVTETSITVTWTEPGDVNITGYRVTLIGGLQTINGTTAHSPYIATGLFPGVIYHITVYSISENETSAGISKTETTRPSSVTGFNVSAVGLNYVNLTWMIPTDNNTMSYTYVVVTNPRNVNISNITTNSVQVTGLSPGVDYNFTIYTVTANGVRSLILPGIQSTTRPSSVTGFNVSAVGLDHVNLTWTFPTDTNKHTYIYTVVRNPGNLNISNITTNYVQVTGLSPGVNYSFTIYTVTTNRVESLTLPGIQSTARPSTVSGLNVSAVGLSYVNLTWTIPTDINNKTYTYKVLGNPGNLSTSNIATNNVQMTGLSPGVNYSFTIYTVTANGVESPTFTGIQSTTRPSTVSGLNVSAVGLDYVTLTWTIPTDINNKTYTYKVLGDPGNLSTSNIATNNVQMTGLSPGVNYSFTIYTVTANGVESPTFTGIQSTTRPSTVSGLNVSAVGLSYVNLTWTIPTDINNKTYTYKVLGNPGNLSTSNIATNNVQMTGLSPGVNYKFTIYTVTSNGVESPTFTEIQSTTRPSSVFGLYVTAVGLDYVNLTWTIPTDINNKTYTYKVLGDPGNLNTNNIATNNVQMTGLSPGVNYKFTIYTVTSNGVESLTFTEIQSTTRPSAVSGFRVSAVGLNYVNLNWTFPNDTNKDTYTYTVIREPDNLNITNITTNNVLMTGLSPGVNYNFTVYTVTSNGVQSLTFMGIQSTTRPSTVSGFHVSAVGFNYVNLNWTFPNDTNKDTYTYSVIREPDNLNITNITTNYVQVTGLSPGVNYNFTIYTVTSDGVQSPALPGIQSTTRGSTELPDSALCPQNPTLLNTSSNASTNFSTVMEDRATASGYQGHPLSLTSVSSAVGLNYVNLNWTFPNDTNKDTYTYTVIREPGNLNISNITTNYVQVTGLSPGENYKFTIYTVTSNNVESLTLPGIQSTTRPSNVSDFHVSAMGLNYVNLNWTFPNDTNKDTYTYMVLGEPGNLNTSNITTNYVQMTGLLSGVNYKFTIYTVTSNRVCSATFLEAQSTTRPSTVLGFNVSAVELDYVNLTWTIPNDTNKDTYTYTVIWNPGNLNISNITTNYVQVTGLSPGVTYSFTIYTVTSNGVESLTLPGIQSTAIPHRPGNLIGVTNGVSELFISWTAPTDETASSYHYQVQWSNLQDQAQRRSGLNTTTDTNFTIKDLLPGNLYKITVVSVISNTQSADYVIYLQTNPVSANTFTVTSIYNTTATLNWTPPDNSTNSHVSGYLIQYGSEGEANQSKETDLTSSVLDNLIPGSRYVFTLKTIARSAKPGITSRALSSDIITYSAEIRAESQTDPDPVKNPQCSMIDGYQIKVTFDCPPGRFTSLQVLVNNKREINTTFCNESVTVSNLQPAKSYQISVKTVAMLKTAITEILSCSTDNTAVIVGSIFGVLLFLLLIGLIVFFVMKKRRSKGQPESIATVVKGRKYHTVTKERFKLHYDRNHADSDFGFAEEYQELSSVGTTQSKRAAEMSDNRAKNRFTNVLPYDHSRVKLSTVDAISSTDYINANYMPGYNSTKEFIASQGPLTNTTADYWRMIWEHHVNTIVMLTNCMENGRTKCEHYWPLDYTPCTYGDITVTVTSETILSEWTIRDFSVKNAKQQGIKYVRHFHFTAWPDHGVPDSTTSIIEFRNLVREHMDQQKSNGPTIVHCSAGVGRTGTLIALDYLIQQMEKEHRVGIYGFVEKMRMNRTLMVQTEAQYVFLNKCMLDLIEQPEENIYENQNGTELIYENASAVRDYRRENV